MSRRFTSAECYYFALVLLDRDAVARLVLVSVCVGVVVLSGCSVAATAAAAARVILLGVDSGTMTR